MQATQKKTCQIFVPKKNPGIENFKSITWNPEYPAPRLGSMTSICTAREVKTTKKIHHLIDWNNNILLCLIFYVFYTYCTKYDSQTLCSWLLGLVASSYKNIFFAMLQSLFNFINQILYLNLKWQASQLFVFP